MRSHANERGFVLISALLLLLVMTILGVAMFRSFGLLERIAGNTREKQRALHAAESAQTYAEWWLTSSAGANATAGTACSASLVSTPQVCSNALASVTSAPWTTGVTYDPPGLTVGTAGNSNDYAQLPAFYISYLTGSYDVTHGTQTNSYQIDAIGYGGNLNSAAVTESAYTVSVTYTTEPPPAPGGFPTKFANLGGQ